VKKAVAMMLAFVLMLSVAGCAKKTPSEQLAADAKKAANQMNKDVNNLFK
jgi:predicted small lipoprotein YifL